MSIRIVRFASLAKKPWKNGGGATAEIAVAPAGAGLDDFDWRLSIADIAADGAFSRFDGIDRTTALLAGAGVVLEVAGDERRVDLVGETIAFPGDAPAFARLVAGPIRDFNVMTRRGRFTHEVVRVAVGVIAPFEAQDEVVAIVALEDGTIAFVEGESLTLNACDTLICCDIGPRLRINRLALRAAIHRP